MSFNSLANIFLADRGDTCVSFTASGNISWKQFLIDVSSLILAINKSSAQSVAICCDNSYLFSVAFFAVISADPTCHSHVARGALLHGRRLLQ